MEIIDEYSPENYPKNDLLHGPSGANHFHKVDPYQL